MQEQPYEFFKNLHDETEIKIEQLARNEEMPQVLYSLENDYPFSCEFWFFSVLNETNVLHHDDDSIQTHINDYCYEELTQTALRFLS